jgi:hypothetical protein
MSTYALVQRGVAHADSSVGGGVSPLDITLASTIKLGSAFLSCGRPKERRKEAAVQAGTISITDADAGPTKDSGALTAFDVASSFVLSTLSQKRTDAYSGASVKIKDSTHVTATFHQPAAGDTIDIDFQLVEKKSYKGATLRILNATTIRLEWDGTLTAGETIDVAYDLFDLSAFGDDVKEILFRQQRALGVAGENSLQDTQVYDTAGNPTSFRIRTFDSKAHRLLATKDIVAGFPETGELSRVTVTLTWPTGKNRPTAITSDLTDLIATPLIG